MMLQRLDVLARITGGKICSGSPALSVIGLFTDTRTPVRGGLFLALRGDRFDGNLFAREAIESLGAGAVLLDCPGAVSTIPPGAGAILVSDSRDAYLAIASAHRDRLKSPRWFGITGSVGKSTTKEMLSHILDCLNWKAHKAKGSFNNAVGLSHTILDAKPEHLAVVLELGTNHPGEIAQLAAVARPNIAVITCAAESHLEHFQSVENVAREKSEILSFQKKGDVAVINADDPHLEIWRAKAKQKIVTFGTGEQALVRAKHISVRADGCARFMVRCGDAIAECALQVAGIHQVHNALAAISAAMAAGIRLADAVHAMCSFEGVTRRFSVSSRDGITIIDDTYNANPASFRAALRSLETMKADRKFVIAGDMLELGSGADEYHRRLGEQVVACGASALFTVGEQARISGEVSQCHGLAWQHCNTPEHAAELLKPLLRPGDTVLVKGSHGVHLEKCLQHLRVDVA